MSITVTKRICESARFDTYSEGAAWITSRASELEGQKLSIEEACVGDGWNVFFQHIAIVRYQIIEQVSE